MRVEVWGVLNVTPDSFSDGGRWLDPRRAIAHGVALVAAGADVIDVGGESSRPRGRAYGPGFQDVTAEEEEARVVPVIHALVRRHGARVSIDTTKPSVARAALDAGATIVNDVSCASNPALAAVAVRAGAEYVVMHRRGRGSVADAEPYYDGVVREVTDELLAAVRRVSAAGLAPERIWIDPGVGFSKSADDSLAVLSGLASLSATGFRVIVGPSRKSFIAAVQDAPIERRIGGTIAACLAAAARGASAVRVHDVEEVVQALRVAEAIETTVDGGQSAVLRRPSPSGGAD